MSAATEHRKLAAIMFTDMVGYSALAQRNEALALELLEEHRRIVRGILPKHGGREVKTTGDGFLIEFPSALAAVEAAVAVQQALHERNQLQPVQRQLRLRIGVHVGDVVSQDGDIHGDGVNIAARLEPLAQPGGICVSEDVARQIRNKLPHRLASLGPAELKNIEMPVIVHRIVLPWEGQPSGPSPEVRSEHEAKSQSLVTSAATRCVGILGLLLLAVSVGWWLMHHRSTQPSSNKAAGKIAALAVRPFDDFSGNTNDAYLSDGMTEALTAALGNISALRVPGRSSVMQFKGTTKTIQQMARELNVDAIIEGSVQRASNRLRITAQLIEADTDRHLWATNYDRDLADFFTVQSEVARAVAAEVRARLTPEDQARLARARPVNRDAVEAYLLGMHHWWHWTGEEATNALRYFQKAIELDPSYASAYAGASLAYGDSVRGDAEALPKARAAAQKAIELDPQLADGFVARGYLRFGNDWDWVGAESDLKHALELSPKSSLALDAYNQFLREQGRVQEAIAVSEAALQNDPLSPGQHVGMGTALMFAHRFEEAIGRYKEALDLDPNFGTALTDLAFCYLRTGRTNEAEAQILKRISVSPTRPGIRWELAYLYAATGRKAEALRILAEIRAATAGRQPSLPATAVIYLGLGDKDAALDALEKAYTQHDETMVSLKASPFWDGLRDQPRFQTLVRKVEAGGNEK